LITSTKTLPEGYTQSSEINLKTNNRLAITLNIVAGFVTVISSEARAYLAEVGYYDADYGARPLKRAIQRELQDPLAVKILSGEFHEGETIHVECAKEVLEFTAQATDQPVAA
jgi:ATP-dependent Clp protease ATP-binding subunit ClpA